MKDGTSRMEKGDYANTISTRDPELRPLFKKKTPIPLILACCVNNEHSWTQMVHGLQSQRTRPGLIDPDTKNSSVTGGKVCPYPPNTTGLICYDICNYCLLYDILIATAYLILPGKEQAKIVLKIQPSKGFNMKGFKWDPPDTESA
ncbi:hypothetical protein GRJ2_001033600 [Grus japonensis]|uniref:Uncharacterized protein n=1 Tax=Grus japonensis TaxID=30415 RepID=A0ABC9WJM7_GRUJA